MSRPRFTPLELNVSYDTGKTLTFYEIPNTVYGQPSYALESVVSMQINCGSGLQTFFSGKVKRREHSGENHNEGITYTAYGYPQLANEITVVGTNGYPGAEFVVDTSIASTNGYGVALYRSARDVVTQLFTINASQLTAQGIPTTYDLTGLSEKAQIGESLQLSGGFFSALQEIAAFDPGCRPVFDDVAQKWAFVNLFNAPTVTVNVRSVNLQSHQYSLSTENRFTRIFLVEDPNSDPLVSSWKFHDAALQPAWDEALEATWTQELGSAPLNNPGLLQNEYYPVFRKYFVVESTLPPAADSISVQVYSDIALVESVPGADPDLSFDVPSFDVVETPLGSQVTDGKFSVRIGGSTVNVVYVKSPVPFQVAVEEVGTIPYSTQQAAGVGTSPYSLSASAGLFVTLSEPLIRAGDMSVPGDCIGFKDPDSVRLTWYEPVISPRTILAGGTGGYSGTAYTVFGIQRTKYVTVTREKMTQAYADAMLKLYSDVIVEASLPLEGDFQSEFASLNRRIYVTHNTQLTGIQSIPSLLTGYTYQFGKRGVSTLQLSTDYSALIRQ